MDFHTLENLSVEEILEAHNDAFSNYEVPMELTLEFFKQINIQRGVRYDLSIGAFDNGALVGFILNGIGKWNEKLTAYDCGTGVIQEYQGKGVGGKLFESLLPILKTNNIQQYLLEVIKTNEPAYKLYKGKGFEVVRDFDCVGIEKANLHPNLPKTDDSTDLIFNEIVNPDWSELRAFWDIYPSWQNSTDSIDRLPEKYKIIGVNLKEKLIGYGVIEPRSGGITQLAIHPEYRRNKIGTKLLLKMLQYAPNPPNLHMINIDMKLNTFTQFFYSLGFEKSTEQFEMLLTI